MRKLMIVGGSITLIAISIFLFLIWKNDNTNEDYRPNFNIHTDEMTEDIPYGVSSDSSEATKVGEDILKEGGNAVDAAVAVSYVLGVTDIYSSGLGGGGMMLVDSPEMDPVLYDYQVTTPEHGDGSEKDIGVPGFVSGMEKVHEDYGTISSEHLIQPAIDISNEGFEVGNLLHKRLSSASYRMPVSDLPDLYPDGQAIQSGETLKQKDLAKTLTSIQDNGADTFYKGKIAEEIEDNVDDISKRDLSSYETIKKNPVKETFAGFDVYAPGAPGGGISLIQSLKLAEESDVNSEEDHTLPFMKKMGHINKQVYQDKINNIGDPNYVDVSEEDMLSKDHIKSMTNEIIDASPQKKNDNSVEQTNDDVSNTTHFVIVDKNGMMVSSTNTLSNFFGSGKHVAGMFLNNELRIFSDRSNSPNRKEPGKRPASYIAPTILSKNGNPIIGIGSAGGGRIPNVISQVLIRMLKFDKSPEKAVASARSFIDPQNEKVAVEMDYPNWNNIIDSMENEGYQIDYNQSDNSTYFGSVQLLAIDYENQKVLGAADPRREGNWFSSS